jgi:hypothetical protein
MTGTCERCGEHTGTTTVSYFNTEEICMPCRETERAHPGFAAARAAEEKAVRLGDWNFEGVGLPEELRCQK